MKRLNELFTCSYDNEIRDIKTNSKYVENDDLFVAIKGVTKDRHEYIDEAVRKNAAAIVVSRKMKRSDIPIIRVKNTNKLLPILCSKFYDNPEKDLFIIGITGTNGKTTTAMIIKNMLGSDCAYIGTLGAIYKDIKINLKNTTPDSEELFKILKLFVDQGCKYVAMEVSSEALLRNRNPNLTYDIAILTNITEDHLNIHRSIRNYVNSKYKLFKKLKKNGTAILNRDDSYYLKFKRKVKNKKLTYGKNEKADLIILDYTIHESYTLIKIKKEKVIYEVSSPLRGEYNIYNLFAAILTLYSMNYTIEEIIEKVSSIKDIEGRSEFIDFNQDFSVVLDYAHTPDALNKVLDYLAIIKKKKIITVTGSAGGREKEKRKEMGKVVLEKSDHVIFTMDDPRFESVSSIIDDLIGNSDKQNYERVTDRKEAIEKALDMAREGDIVLIAGKGRDNYMAVLDEYIEYNDYTVIKEYFDKKKN